MTHKGYFGRNRTGKTTRAIAHFHEVQGPRIFVNSQWEEYPLAATQISSLEEIDWGSSQSYNWLIEEDEELLDLLEYGMAVQRSDRPLPSLLIVVDECDRFQALEDKDRWTRAMTEITGKGQRFRFSAWWITQRPKAVDNQIYTQCAEWHFFRLAGPDLLHIKERKMLDLRPFRDHLRKPYHYLWTDEEEAVLYDQAGGRLQTLPIDPTEDGPSDEGPTPDGEGTTADGEGDPPSEGDLQPDPGRGAPDPGVPESADGPQPEERVGAPGASGRKRPDGDLNLPGLEFIGDYL